MVFMDSVAYLLFHMKPHLLFNFFDKKCNETYLCSKHISDKHFNKDITVQAVQKNFEIRILCEN